MVRRLLAEKIPEGSSQLIFTKAESVLSSLKILREAFCSCDKGESPE